MNFTKDQQSVLDDRNSRLLVSASAGSGKTATIIEKIFELIDKDNLDIEKLLVITFTESASMEMKIRLKDSLKEGAVSSTHLRNQLEKLSTSDISTLHSFCSKMIRKYFYFLDLKPNFAVLDENDSKFLKIKALEKLLRDYSKKDDKEFEDLSSIFGGGRSFDNLKSNILSYYEFLHGVENREEFLNSISTICYEEDLSLNKASEFLLNYILGNVSFLTKSLRKYLILAEQQKAEFFVPFIQKVIDSLSVVLNKKDFYSCQSTMKDISLPRMTTKKLGDEEASFKEELKPFWEEMKDKINALKKVCVDRTKDEISNDLSVAKKLIDKFNEVENNFENYYVDLKSKRNGLDFNDLEKYFLKLLEREDIRNSLNYKYVFVDEYQDINCVQEKILSVIANSCKMVMVGDIKQSIYGFRNSTPEIFIDKVKKYTNSTNSEKLVNLNENFRSNPTILDFVNEVFVNCMSVKFGGVDYKNNGQLLGKSSYEKVNNFPVVEVNVVNRTSSKDDENAEDKNNYCGVYSVLDDKNEYSFKLTEARKEAMIVAKRILDFYGKDYYNAKSKTTEKIKFSDFAILCRNNEFLKDVAKVLMEYKVPIAINLVENIYKNKDVEVLLDILKLVNNFHDDEALCVVMLSLFGNFSFDDLSQIRLCFPQEKFYYGAVKLFTNPENFSEEILTTLGKKYDEIFEKIDKLERILADIRDRLLYDSIYNILNFLCEKYDYFEFVSSLPDGNNRLKSVKDFIESFNGADYNYDLVGYLDFVKNYAYEGKFKASFTGGSDSVKLGTIHSSKGLEYPIVFVVGCGQGFSRQLYKEEILKDKDFGLGINTFDLNSREKLPNIARNAITLFKSRQERAEELRLLYVALTRAKNHLIVVGEIDLNKYKTFSHLEDAEGVTNYMPWILSMLKSYNLSSLISKQTCKQKLEEGEVVFNAFVDEDFEIRDSEKRDFKFGKANLKEVKKLKNIIDFKFPIYQNIALKNSVSSLLREHNEGIESLNFSPKKLSIFESKSEGFSQSKLGTFYHSIMEQIDFTKTFNREVFEDVISALNIEKEYREKISYKKIVNCVNSIKNLGGNNYQKELPFISFLPYNEVFNEGNADKVIIQGIADLLVGDTENNYLIDYKITYAENSDQLVEKYLIQLKLYKICLEKALNMRFNKVFIYSFCLDKLIEVPMD